MARRNGGFGVVHVGGDLTAEQVEFGKAMWRLRQLLGRTPTVVEVFRAAKAMGYRRPPK